MPLFAIAALTLALSLRVLALPLVTTDTRLYLIPWQTHADAVGGGYLREPFTNYAPFYEHVLAFLALFPGDPVLRIKLSSIAFDFALAGAVALCVPRGRRLLAVALLPLLPTTILNSAALGQCDSIYATCLMLSLAAALRRRPIWTILCFSAAVAVKLQAVFFGPVLVLLWLERRHPWWTFVLIPVGYVVTALPMLVAGRDVAATFLVYLDQAGTFQTLAANAPNPWSIAKKIVDYKIGVLIGLPLAAVVTIGATLWLWRRGALCIGAPNGREGLLLSAAVLILLVPYALPMMHERYFYPVDPILLALTLTNRRYWCPLALAQAASTIAYIPFLMSIYVANDPVFGPNGSLRAKTGIGFGVFNATAAVLMTVALALLLRRVWLARAKAAAAA